MTDSDRPIFGGRYELHNRLARGGMSEVFLGRDRVLDRPIAVKVLFREFATDDSFLERFRREARAAAALSHTNVVSVYDWGEQDGTQYIVMEYANGQNLAEVIRSEGPLDPNRAADIAMDIAASLAFAHSNEMIHRDVKPGNVLITTEGRVKVADFGIARALTGRNPDLTQTGSVMGTATYLSPEQSRGYEADQRSDIYSLAVVLYEMLTAGPPFTGDNAVAIAYKHVTEEPLPPRHFNNDIPAALEAICLHGLQKDPANRYATAEDILSDLQAFRSGLGAPIAQAARGVGSDAASISAMSPPVTSAAQGSSQTPGAQTGSRSAVETANNSHEQQAPANAQRGFAGSGAGSGAGASSGASSNPTAVGGSVAPGGATTVHDPGAVAGHTGDTLSGGATTGGDSDFSNGNNIGDIPELQTIQAPDRTPIWIAVLVVMLIVIAGLVFLLVNSITSGDDPAVEVTTVEQLRVPGLVGMNWEEAEALLREQGFEYIVINFEDRDDTERNLVFQQDPRSGVLISPTETAANPIALYVSEGLNTVRVPEVANRVFIEAEQILVAAGFTVDRIDIRNDATAAGVVIEQSVPSTQERPQGTIITLTVSTGRGEVAVPPVEGQTFDDARVTLARAGLVERVERAPSTLVPVDSVISTDPVAGTGLSRGSVVTLLLSDGPEELVVPTIEALGGAEDPQQVVAALQALGFVARIHTASDGQAAGQPHRVIGLNPVPGSILLTGSEVLVLIGFESSNAVVPSLSSLGTTNPSEVVAKLRDLGFRTVLAERGVPATSFNIGRVVELDPVAGTPVYADSQVISVIVGVVTTSEN